MPQTAAHLPVLAQWLLRSRSPAPDSRLEPGGHQLERGISVCHGDTENEKLLLCTVPTQT